MTIRDYAGVRTIDHGLAILQRGLDTAGCHIGPTN